jgi:hypothetical protein
MCKRLFSFLIITILLMCGRSMAQEGTSITHTFSPGNNSFEYFFPGNGSLRVEFVGGVLRNFDLTVTVVTLTDAQLGARLDPKVFPAGTTCFHYGSPTGCKEYAFTGTAGGPNGVPVKNVDYKPPIRLTLTYTPVSTDTVKDPAFGHAPGESTTFSEDILIDYTNVSPDDTMDGSTPSLSSVIALNKPLEETDSFCWVSPPTDGQTYTVGTEVAVEFQLFASGGCPNTGTSIRDHFARLSLVDANAQFQPVRSDEGGKNFQFDNNEKVNEREFSTAGLAPGFYSITVRSTKFSPQTRQIQLVTGP